MDHSDFSGRSDHGHGGWAAPDRGVAGGQQMDRRGFRGLGSGIAQANQGDHPFTLADLKEQPKPVTGALGKSKIGFRAGDFGCAGAQFEGRVGPLLEETGATAHELNGGTLLNTHRLVQQLDRDLRHRIRPGNHLDVVEMQRPRQGRRHEERQFGGGGRRGEPAHGISPASAHGRFQRNQVLAIHLDRIDRRTTDLHPQRALGRLSQPVGETQPVFLSGFRRQVLRETLRNGAIRDAKRTDTLCRVGQIQPGRRLIRVRSRTVGQMPRSQR